MTRMTVTANATRVSSAGASDRRVRKRELLRRDLAREDEIADRHGVQRGDENGSGCDVLRDLRHRIERRRSDVDRGLDRRVHELRDEDERDREQQDRQLELARAESDCSDENGSRKSEVDPEIPLRADGVHDPFGREVEALEQGLAPLAGHPRTCSSSRVSISTPWS